MKYIYLIIFTVLLAGCGQEFEYTFQKPDGTWATTKLSRHVGSGRNFIVNGTVYRSNIWSRRCIKNCPRNTCKS
jgi:hypothetical protein